jgi:DNA-binding CsgD family transcriptional regulator
MIGLRRIERDPVPASVLPSYEGALRAAGHAGFYDVLSRSIRQALPVDRLYLIRGSTRASPLIAEGEAGKPFVSGETYVRQFLPADPLQAAIDAGSGDDAVLRLLVAPRDIRVPAYRTMLERAGVTERLSYLRRTAKGWWCMTLVRRRPAGPFTDGELDWLGGYFRLLLPMIELDGALPAPPATSADRIAQLEERFARRHPELTRRECQVCARAAIGISIEGAALDLGIGIASVLTYRQRAYRRLAVGSAFELARLVMH